MFTPATICYSYLSLFDSIEKGLKLNTIVGKEFPAKETNHPYLLTGGLNG